MKRKGFTLIELLVVIAIIAILAAILFPVFATAKEKGRQVTCTSNLKQLMLGIRTYCDDNNGGMPSCCYDQPTPHLSWAGDTGPGTAVVPRNGQLWRYVKNTKIYQCPSDMGKATTWGNRTYALSYSMNELVGSLYGLRAYQSPCNLDVQTAGRAGKIMVLLHEQRTTINDGFFAWCTSTDSPSAVHGNGTIVAYADGHAKFQTITECQRIIAFKTNGPWAPNAWNPKNL